MDVTSLFSTAVSLRCTYSERVDRPYAGEFTVTRTQTPGGTPYLLMNMPYYLGTMLPEYIAWLVDNHKL